MSRYSDVAKKSYVDCCGLITNGVECIRENPCGFCRMELSGQRIPMVSGDALDALVYHYAGHGKDNGADLTNMFFAEHDRGGWTHGNNRAAS